jgi:acyl carrier protein
MIKSEFLKNLEDLIEADPGSLTEGSVLAETPQWDSMAIMGFIAFADEEMGESPSPAAIRNCVTVADLIALVGI